MFCCNKTCFTVRDGALVGDFRDAIQPMVWRMDLSRVQAAGFRVAQNGGQWDLLIEGPNGSASPVAGFNSADKAERALRGLSCALRRSGAPGRLGGWLGKLSMVILVFLLVFYGLPSLLRSFSGAPVPVMTQPQGTSLPADQVLRVPPSNTK